MHLNSSIVFYIELLAFTITSTIQLLRKTILLVSIVVWFSGFYYLTQKITVYNSIYFVTTMTTKLTCIVQDRSFHSPSLPNTPPHDVTGSRDWHIRNRCDILPKRLPKQCNEGPLTYHFLFTASLNLNVYTRKIYLVCVGCLINFVWWPIIYTDLMYFILMTIKVIFACCEIVYKLYR